MSTGESVAGDRGLARIPFTVEAEGQIKGLSFWLTILGWLNVVAGVLNIISVVMPARNFGHFVDALVHFLIGVWALQAARAFRNLATTDTADQAYLVEGFTRLRSIFLLQGILILIVLAFVAAVFLFVMLHVLAQSPH